MKLHSFKREHDWTKSRPVKRVGKIRWIAQPVIALPDFAEIWKAGAVVWFYGREKWLKSTFREVQDNGRWTI